MTVLEELKFLTWLKASGYRGVRPIPGGCWAGVQQFMFTWAIIKGQLFDRFGYSDRWCYHTSAEALAALEAWNGVGEPTGWHRHPATGRRRPQGNTQAEYVNL